MIGVCIKYFHENYGGMLQAYATTQILEARGIDYELIRYRKTKNVSTLIRYMPRLLNGVLINDKVEALKKKAGMKKHPEFASLDSIRMDAFKQFNEAHFTRLSREYIGYDELCEGARLYSAFITGSDQLWSPAGLPTNFYNLMFVPEDIRKISYASSFGVKQIPWYQKTRTRDFLTRIEFISMRENRGSEIVEELIGRKVQVVLDPVLMFNQKKWESLIPLKKEFDEPYIFAYFLGSNPKYRAAVEKLAEKNGLKIVALRHLDQYIEEDEKFGDYAPYDVGPDRFLNLLRGARFVCTDSFHGACFSIIHKKQFMVFNRYSEGSKHSKNSRIDTLCENLGLEGRRYEGHIKRITMPIDYDSVFDKLHVLKREADEYLDRAFEGVS